MGELKASVITLVGPNIEFKEPEKKEWAMLTHPLGICIDAEGKLYLCDSNNVIRKVSTKMVAIERESMRTNAEKKKMDIALALNHKSTSVSIEKESTSKTVIKSRE